MLVSFVIHSNLSLLDGDESGCVNFPTVVKSYVRQYTQKKRRLQGFWHNILILFLRKHNILINVCVI